MNNKLKSLATDEYIGFTHILGVCEDVWNKYCKRLIADNRLKAHNIISLNVSDRDEIHGFILFSAGISDKDMDFIGEFH